MHTLHAELQTCRHEDTQTPPCGESPYKPGMSNRRIVPLKSWDPA
jgi:hypothetical protein